MAPEVEERRPYDISSDVWSVGCIIYELLSLSPPRFQIRSHQVANRHSICVHQIHLFDRLNRHQRIHIT